MRRAHSPRPGIVVFTTSTAFRSIVQCSTPTSYRSSTIVYRFALIMSRLLLSEGTTEQKRIRAPHVKLAAFALTLVFFVACICWRFLTSTLLDSVDPSQPIENKTTVISQITNSHIKGPLQVPFDFPVPPSEWLEDMDTNHTSMTCGYFKCLLPSKTNQQRSEERRGRQRNTTTAQLPHQYGYLVKSLRKSAKAGNWRGISPNTLPSGTS